MEQTKLKQIRKLEQKIKDVEQEWEIRFPGSYSYPHWQVKTIRDNIEKLKCSEKSY